MSEPNATQACAVQRPWWAEDLRAAASHFAVWFSAYAAAALAATTALQLALPDIEHSFSPSAFHVIKGAVSVLIIIKEIRDARRPKNTRSTDPNP